MSDYDFTEKGQAFLEAFVDPGPPFDPAEGPDDSWFRTVVENAAELIVGFQHDGTVVYASPSSHTLLGHVPQDLVGTNVLDLLHPDELDNAADTIYHAAEIEGWRPARPFRLRHADGSYATYEVEGLSLFHEPTVKTLVCIARYAESSARVDAIVGLLAANADLPEILDELVHVMDRPGWIMDVAIQYGRIPGSLAVTHTGLADELATFDRDDLASPWGRAVESGQPVYDVGLETLRPELAERARAAGYRTCWAIPRPDTGHDTALVVVWNYDFHVPELGQQIVLDKLVQLLDLALAGRRRSEQLLADANTDPLTGLGNRRSFDLALAAAPDRDVAVIVVDLDGFKTVNDAFGHASGDEVLRAIGKRVLGHVRHADLVARLGGDEFAIVCLDVQSSDDLVPLAERLITSIAAPVATAKGNANVGASIGIARSTPDAPTAAHNLVELADHELYTAKQAGKGQFRLTSTTDDDL